MSKGRENILLIAYGCEPGRGSEPGIGWANAMATVQARPTWILTHPAHRDPLDAAIREWNANSANPRMHAIYVDVPTPLRPLERMGYAGFNVYYYLWSLAAGRAALRLHQEVGIDLVQHVSLMRWWMPSAAMTLAKRGVPFIWGALSSGETMPWRFQRGIGLRGRLTEFCRLAARTIFTLDPRLGSCARSATLALGAHADTQRRLERLGCTRVEQAIGAPGDVAGMQQITPAPKPAGTFRVISGGGMVYWKCFDLSVRAFAQAFGDVPEAEYVHVCGGKELPRVRELAERLGVANRVKLLGEMPHHESLRWIASADMLVHPVLRDTSGHLPEALAAGVPVLTIDRLSPNAIVDDTCGRRISIEACWSRAEFANALALEMRQWFDNPSLRHELSRGARLRAQELSLDHFTRNLHAHQASVLAAARQATRRSRAATTLSQERHSLV